MPSPGVRDPLITSALAVAVLALTVLAWEKRIWSVVGRLRYSLVTQVGLLFIWFANYWNLLGFRF